MKLALGFREGFDVRNLDENVVVVREDDPRGDVETLILQVVEELLLEPFQASG